MASEYPREATRARKRNSAPERRAVEFPSCAAMGAKRRLHSRDAAHPSFFEGWLTGSSSAKTASRLCPDMTLG
jgi:hypothetical protein